MSKMTEARMPSLKDKILATAEVKPKHKHKKVKKLGGSGRILSVSEKEKKGKKHEKK